MFNFKKKIQKDKKNSRLWYFIRVAIIIFIPFIASLFYFDYLTTSLKMEYNEPPGARKTFCLSSDGDNIDSFIKKKIEAYNDAGKLFKIDFNLINYNIYFKNELYYYTCNIGEKIIKTPIKLSLDSSVIDYTIINPGEDKIIFFSTKMKNFLSLFDGMDFGFNFTDGENKDVKVCVIEKLYPNFGSITIKIEPLKKYLILIYFVFLLTWLGLIKAYQEIVKIIKFGFHK